MKIEYKGYEINCEREDSCGGDEALYFQVVRISDGWYVIDDLEYSGEYIRTKIKDLKSRIDKELKEKDPWEEKSVKSLGQWNP